MTSSSFESEMWRILVIEDNAGDIYLIREAFSASNLKCEVTEFLDSEKALLYLKQLQAAKGEGRPHLVLLDLNLPKVDSTEILQAIRGCQFMAGTPVIIFSSSVSQRDRDRVTPYTVARHLAKPTDLTAFLTIGDTVTQVLAEVYGQDAVAERAV